MARVYLTSDQKVNGQVKKLSKWGKGKLVSCGIRQQDLADYIGVTVGAVSNCFNRNKITMQMLIGICEMCDVPQEELKEVLTI